MTASTSHSEACLVSQFVRELEAVGGRILQAESDQEAAEKIAATAKAANVRSAGLGDGVATNLDTVAAALERAGIETIRPMRVEDSERAAVRERIARCDLGVAEADYGVASTGTFAVASGANRPGSLTLLPPISVVILRTERIVTDLAALFDKFGPAAVAANRLTLITGPSRTADIEKRIVMGVHGPRELYAMLVRLRDG